MIFASLLAKLGFETSQWTSGKDKAVNDLKDLDGKTKSFLKDLKSNFGKSSVMGQLSKLFVGGGAIAGLKMVASEIYHVADSWVGTSKAADEATDAAKRYNDIVKAVEEARKMAKEWELSMNERLIKSYRDLDTARHPENKEKNAAAEEVDDVNAALEKEKNIIKELQKEIEASKKRSEVALKDLIPLNQGEQEIKDRAKTYQSGGSDPSYAMLGGNYIYDKLYSSINGGRMNELNKTIDDEQSAIRQATDKIIILRKQAAADEIKSNELKNNIIEKADLAATAETIKKTTAMMENRREKEIKDADEELDYRKKQMENAIVGLEANRDQAMEKFKESAASSHYEVQQTRAMRNVGGGVVLALPKIQDAAVAIHKANNDELKKINLEIADLKKKIALLTEQR